jgi:hypothetical protein
MTRRRLPEVGSERFHELPNPIVDLGESARSHPLLPERYVKGEVAVHLHLQVGVGKLDARDLCATYYATPVLGDISLGQIPGDANRAGVNFCNRTANRSADSDGKAHEMLDIRAAWTMSRAGH